MMESLTTLYWIIGVILLYVCIGFWAVLVREGVRYRDYKTLAGSFVSLIPAVVHWSVSGVMPVPARFISTILIALVGLSIFYALGPKRVSDWKRIKARNGYRRQVTLHMVLVTGSIIFIMPFIWLLITSVKEEDQIFKYPPVWIPTRQVMADMDGKKVGLSTMKCDGRTVNVAELKEYEDGTKDVCVIPPSANPASRHPMIYPGYLEKAWVGHVDRSELAPIRKFGLKWDNYSEALDFLPPETHKGLLYLWNTIYMSSLAILGTILSSSLVAYSFARLRWPGRDQLFMVLLATMMIPGAVTMMPVFLIFRYLGWVDTLRPLWIPSFFGGAFSVFLLRQFFMTIPNDLEDAAKIDGCSYFGIYWRIMLPLIKPALAALTIMTFMGTWNNFMGPLIYINSPQKMPLAYALQLFQGAHGAEYGLLMAASTLMMLPVLTVFFFTQRYFIQGITLTGIKG